MTEGAVNVTEGSVSVTEGTDQCGTEGSLEPTAASGLYLVSRMDREPFFLLSMLGPVAGMYFAFAACC